MGSWIEAIILLLATACAGVGLFATVFLEIYGEERLATIAFRVAVCAAFYLIAWKGQRVDYDIHWIYRRTQKRI